MYKYSTLAGIARTSGWRDVMGEEYLPLYLPVSVLNRLDEEHPYRYNAQVFSEKVLGIPLDTVISSVEGTRNLMNVSSQLVPPEEPAEEAQPAQQQQVIKVLVQVPGAGKGKSGSGMPQYVQGTGAAKNSSNGKPIEGDGEGNAPPPPDPIEEREWKNDRAFSDGDVQEWVKREVKWGAKQKESEWKKQLFSGMGTRWHGNYGGEESKTSLGDRKLAEKMRVSLDKLVGSFDMQITPLWNVKKLVTRMITHRTLDPARKEEEGRPTILILSDISGSCHATSEMSTLAANSACMLGTLDADIYSLPVSDYMYQPGVEPQYHTHGMSYHNGRPLVFSRYDTRFAKAIQKEATNPLSFTRFGVPLPIAQKMVTNVGAGGDYRRGGAAEATLQTLALSAEMRRPFNLKSKMWDDGIIPYIPMHESTQLGNMMTKLADMNHPLLSWFSKLQEFGRKPVFHTEEWAKQHKVRYAELFLRVEREMKKYPETRGQDMPFHKVSDIEVSPSGKYLANAIIPQINADIVIFYTDTDGIPLIKEILPMLQSHQRLYVLTYLGMPNMVVDGNRFRIKSSIEEQGWTPRYPEYGFTVHGTVPTVAFRPSRQYDYRYIPGWVGGRTRSGYVGGLAALSGCLGAEKLTIIPNVADLPGYLKAIEMIVSPDKMTQALNGGKSILAKLAEHNHLENNPMK